MASPQIQNGYIKLANEIMDALVGYRIPGQARQVLDFILRKTYGFNKKEDVIPLSQFVEATGMKKPAVCRAINLLINRGMIIKKDNPRGTSYRFVKDFHQWERLSKKITTPSYAHSSTGALSKKITPVIKKDNSSFNKIGDFLRNRYQKRDTQKT